MTEEDIDRMLDRVCVPPGTAPPLEELHRYGHHNWLSRAIHLQNEVVRTLVKAIATDADMDETKETNLEIILGNAVRLEASLRLHKLGGEVK